MKVIEDCSRAIELNPKYLKCIQRRARAAEKSNNLELALEGWLTLIIRILLQTILLDRLFSYMFSRFISSSIRHSC
jgi:hypothetical protein